MKNLFKNKTARPTKTLKDRIEVGEYLKYPVSRNDRGMPVHDGFRVMLITKVNKVTFEGFNIVNDEPVKFNEWDLRGMKRVLQVEILDEIDLDGLN